MIREEQTATIVIGGDIYPGERYSDVFAAGDAESIFNDLLPEFEQADFSVVNLECPLIERRTPILKSGRALGARKECIRGVSALGVDLVNLANNHIMDHGEQGLQSTLNVCQSEGIATVGAGKNLQEAAGQYSVDVKGIRLAVMSIAEHEFSIATDTSCGAAPLDIIENAQSIRKIKGEVDYLILLFHGGNEH
jgi:poly-gamma-glutamate synthesis protein (capsule biosynthesis protein)